MRIFQASIAILMLLLVTVEAGARDARAIWEDRCEECHGDSVKFANKYLWDIEGQLQGQHHIDNLSLFMRNHYIPDHAVEKIRNMLLAQANSPIRFKAECGDCHGEITEFVEKSLWVRGSEITGLESGLDIGEFLPTHLELQPEDVAFYRKLFARVAGKPIP
jgi:hypothetical protein